MVVFDASSESSGGALWWLVSPGSVVPGVEVINLREHFASSRLRSSAAFELSTLTACVRLILRRGLKFGWLLAFGDPLSAVSAISRQTLKEHAETDYLSWSHHCVQTAEAAAEFLLTMFDSNSRTFRPWLAVWHRRDTLLARAADGLSVVADAVPWLVGDSRRRLIESKGPFSVDLAAACPEKALSEAWCAVGSLDSERASLIPAVMTIASGGPSRWPSAIPLLEGEVWRSPVVLGSPAALVWAGSMVDGLKSQPGSSLTLVVPAGTSAEKSWRNVLEAEGLEAVETEEWPWVVGDWRPDLWRFTPSPQWLSVSRWSVSPSNPWGSSSCGDRRVIYRADVDILNPSPSLGSRARATF
jgi:hypothetical protein